MNSWRKRRSSPRGQWQFAHVACATLTALGVLGCGSASTGTGVNASDQGEDDDTGKPLPQTSTADAGDVSEQASDDALSPDPTAAPTEPPATNPTDEGPEPTNGETPASTSEASPLPIDLAAERANYRVVRLTHSQWENSVRQLLGLDAPTGLVDGFTPDALVSTFSNDQTTLQVGSNLQADYAAAAETLAATVTSTQAQLSLVAPETDPTEFVQAFGRRAFRRTLTSEEATRYLALYERGVELSVEADFLHGARLVIEAMLQAPQFLYRSELGDDGAALSGFEIASKLSFALRDTAPDVDWIDRAEQGEFDSEDGVVAAAAELLETPDAVQQMSNYQAQVLHFTRLSSIEKATETDYDPALNASLRTASELFFDDIFTSGRGVNDIFGATQGYVDAALAKLYGISDVADGWTQVDLGDSRRGYFTQLPFLILHSVNLTPDPIHRGAELQTRVLCGKLMAPFTGIDLAPRMESDTNREYIANLTESGECAACHKNYINPLGFAFENFDGMGQLRTSDNGQPVVTSGEYPFVEGSQTFADATELMQLLESSSQAHACYVRNLGEFLLARRLSTSDSDATTLQTLAEGSLAGNSIKQLILEWVKSPLFRTRVGVEG
jgi:hypothetical protein